MLGRLRGRERREDSRGGRHPRRRLEGVPPGFVKSGQSPPTTVLLLAFPAVVVIPSKQPITSIATSTLFSTRPGRVEGFRFTS